VCVCEQRQKERKYLEEAVMKFGVELVVVYVIGRGGDTEIER